MNEHLKKRLRRTAILSLLGLGIGAAIGLAQIGAQTATQSAHVVQKPGSDLPVAGVQVGGPFSLTDQNGQAVTEKNYDGQYKLIYFGFTYCPAICPTELQKITRVMNALGADADKIQPLFITIDPARDDVETMRSYVALFHPRLAGLTGTRAQIDAALKAYKVFASKVKTPEMSDYTMDHSSLIYLMSPENALISIYRIEDSSDFMLQDIRPRLKDSSLL